jgi:hypothetical protein
MAARAGGGRKPPRTAAVKSRGGELAEKAPVRCQVRAEKTNASEPLRKCRKRIDDIETGVELLPRDESGGGLPCWPGGVRHIGGVISVQAPAWNVGSCRADVVGLRVDVAGVREDPKQPKL